MNCPRCHEVISSETSLCSHCGHVLGSNTGIPLREHPFPSPKYPTPYPSKAEPRRKKGFFASRQKINVCIALFYVVLLSYLVVETLFPTSRIVRISTFWGNPFLDFFLLAFFLFAASTVLYYCFDLLLRILYATGLYRPKLGRLLVYEGYLNKNQLQHVLSFQNHKLGETLVNEGYVGESKVKQALTEQKLRIGEILLLAQKISSEQLLQALEVQKKVSKKLGVVLRGLGYAKKEDIDWALQRMKRRLGEILVDLGHATEEQLQWAIKRMNLKLGEILRMEGFLTDYEIHSMLSLQSHGKRWH